MLSQAMTLSRTSVGRVVRNSRIPPPLYHERPRRMLSGGVVAFHLHHSCPSQGGSGSQQDTCAASERVQQLRRHAAPYLHCPGMRPVHCCSVTT